MIPKFWWEHETKLDAAFIFCLLFADNKIRKKPRAFDHFVSENRFEYNTKQDTSLALGHFPLSNLVKNAFF